MSVVLELPAEVVYLVGDVAQRIHVIHHPTAPRTSPSKASPGERARVAARALRLAYANVMWPR